MSVNMPTKLCMYVAMHVYRIIIVDNFRGAKYSWFSWLNTAWTTNILPTNEATLPTITQTTK